MKELMRFLKDDEGQDLSEYVAILGAVAVVAAAVVYRYRDRLMQMWNNAIANLR
jgi:Flp pilus assembly pilin Flp